MSQTAPPVPPAPRRRRGLVAVQRTPETLAEVISDPDAPVLTAALPRIVTGALKRVGLRRVRIKWIAHSMFQAPFVATIGACVLVLVLGRRPGIANLNAPALVLLIGLMVRWSRKTWREFVALAGPLDEIVADPDEREDMALRMARRLRWTPQILISGLGFLAGLALGIFTVRETGSGTYADVLPVLVDGIAVGLGANVMYWLWCAVTWLSTFSGLRSIRLAPDPETDPAITGCQRMVSAVRWRVLFGLLCAEFPLVALSVDASGDSIVPMVVSALVFLICLVTGVAVGALPVLYMGRLRGTDRDNEVARIRKLRDDACRRLGAAERLSVERDYRHTVAAIRAQSLYGINLETVVMTLATVISPLMPLIVTVWG